MYDDTLEFYNCAKLNIPRDPLLPRQEVHNLAGCQLLYVTRRFKEQTHIKMSNPFLEW